MTSISAGQFNQRLQLQSATVVSDGFGETVPTWTTQATVWGVAAPIRGREFFTAMANQSELSIKFVIRYRADITKTWRVVWKGTSYDVISDPIDPLGEMKVLELMCATAKN